MKFIAILFAIFAIASAVNQETYKLPQAVVDKVHHFALPCAKEHNVDVALIPKVADGTLPRDEATNNFLLCFTKGAGYITDDGHMVVDKLADIVKDHPRVEEFREALKKCNEVTKESTMATLIAMNICFAEAPPIRFVF